jgi:hypothetical protein
MSDMSERLTRLERDILGIVKKGAQTLPFEISAFVLDRMDFTKPKVGKKGVRRLPPNKGDRLRTLYGNLTRALTPGQKGNVSEVSLGGKSIVNIKFGFDPKTQVKQGPRTGDLRYGVLHEYGGTIKHPGGTAYFSSKGKTRFVSNESAGKYFAKTGRELPRTKAHSITIPARPYLRPGIKDFQDDPAGYAAFVDELLVQIKIKLGAK